MGSTLIGRTQPGGVVVIDDLMEHPGETVFVHSGTGTDGAGYGREPGKPFATIDYAIGQCTADKGDVILVMPGHVEDLESGETIDADVAGISIIGLGSGPSRPRIDFNHATASIDVGAHGVTIRNLVLRPSVTVVSIGIDVEAGKTDTLLEDIEFVPGEEGDGTDEFVLGVDIKAGCTRTTIRRMKYRHHASCDGANAGVSLTGASDGIVIEDSDIEITGAAAVAPIKGITTLSTRLRIRRCTLVADAEPGIELLTGTTGVIHDNDIFANLGTIDAAIVTDGCALFRNQYCEVGGEAGAEIGTPSVDD
jgi:hypothetical protein